MDSANLHQKSSMSSTVSQNLAFLRELRLKIETNDLENEQALLDYNISSPCPLQMQNINNNFPSNYQQNHLKPQNTNPDPHPNSTKHLIASKLKNIQEIFENIKTEDPVSTELQVTGTLNSDYPHSPISYVTHYNQIHSPQENIQNLNPPTIQNHSNKFTYSIQHNNNSQNLNSGIQQIIRPTLTFYPNSPNILSNLSNFVTNNFESSSTSVQSDPSRCPNSPNILSNLSNFVQNNFESSSTSVQSDQQRNYSRPKEMSTAQLPNHFSHPSIPSSSFRPQIHGTPNQRPLISNRPVILDHQILSMQSNIYKAHPQLQYFTQNGPRYPQSQNSSMIRSNLAAASSHQLGSNLSYINNHQRHPNVVPQMTLNESRHNMNLRSSTSLESEIIDLTENEDESFEHNIGTNTSNLMVSSLDSRNIRPNFKGMPSNFRSEPNVNSTDIHANSRSIPSSVRSMPSDSMRNPHSQTSIHHDSGYNLRYPRAIQKNSVEIQPTGVIQPNSTTVNLGTPPTTTSHTKPCQEKQASIEQDCQESNHSPANPSNNNSLQPTSYSDPYSSYPKEGQLPYILTLNRSFRVKINPEARLYFVANFNSHSNPMYSLIKIHYQKVKRMFKKCKICDLDRNYYRFDCRHKRIDFDILRYTNTYYCDFDGRIYQTRNGFEIHMKTHVTVKCPECDLDMKESALSTHVNFHHSVDEFKCTICPSVFRNKQLLKSHIAIHDKQFECKVCKWKFARKEILKRHNNAYHNDDRKLQIRCSICDKKFVRRYALRMHLLTHDKTTPKRFKCDRCDFATHVPQTFKVHQRSHVLKDKKYAELEDPVKCSKCPAYLKNEHALKHHMMNVHPKDVCSCDLCGRIIRAKSNMMKHIRIHLKNFERERSEKK